MRSDEDCKYLTNKHKGGIANAKGNLYEDYYVVFQIVSCLARYKNQMDCVSFQSQLENTFVDDLLIAHPSKNVYHQIKNTKSIRWNTVALSRTIASDFEKQIEDCIERDEDFALKLIYSAINSDVKDTIPTSIKKYTSAEFFPYKDDLNALLLISKDFQSVLMQISARGELTTMDELSNLATIFLGVWRKNGNGKRMSLSDIVKQAEALKDFNLAVFPDSQINEKCRVILDSIEKLEYHIRGRKIYWKIGTLNGSCPWDEDLEARIIEEKPSTKIDLLKLL